MVALLKRLAQIVGVGLGILAGLHLAIVRRNPSGEGGGGSERVGATSTGKPNILMFVVDDLDSETLQRLLATNQLPNIRSKIVDGAVSFQNAIVPTSMCTASRATTLTGKYAHNHGAWQVIGDEGPEQFDKYLRSTNNAYLPTWLGPDYFRAFIGKVHLGRHNPNWNFFRPVDGYDARPSMYKANENGVEVMPPVYQTKYIGDSAKQAIRLSGNKPFFAVVAPIAPHVNVSRWRKMDSYSHNSYTGTPVAFSQFRNLSTNIWRQHMVTSETIAGRTTHKWWSRDSASRDSGWSTWTFAGNEVTVAPGTGRGDVGGWNIMQPATNTRRQQLVRRDRSNINFYTRDLVDNQPAQPWVHSGDQSILAGTGTEPLVGWSAIQFPNGLVRQQVIRGTESNGYIGYYRHRLPGPGTFTPWQMDPDWGEVVAFGRVCALNLIPTSGIGYIYQLIVQKPDSTNFEWWQSPEFVDFQALSLAGNNPGRSRTPSAARIGDEGLMMSTPALKWSSKKQTVEGDDLESSDPDGRSATISEVHPYYIMRAYAEGSWSPVHPSQTYNWGGNFPAGRFRANRDPHGFNASSPSYELPSGKVSFNNQRPVPVPYYGPSTWPDLQDRVWGNRQQQDYLRRLYLDRMEQMLSIDRMVGEVIDAAGPNTIIIFTSDNGHINGEQRLSNKLAPLDESVRVPLYIKVPGGQRRQVEHLVSNLDLAPTILDYAGLVWTNPNYNVDGRSLRQLITTGSVSSWRRSLLLEFHKPRGRVFSPTDWRFGLPDYLGLRESTTSSGGFINTLYVQYYRDAADPNSTTAYELYNLRTDPYQTNNLTTEKLAAMDTVIRNFYTASGETARESDMSGIIVV